MKIQFITALRAILSRFKPFKYRDTNPGVNLLKFAKMADIHKISCFFAHKLAENVTVDSRISQQSSEIDQAVSSVSTWYGP